MYVPKTLWFSLSQRGSIQLYRHLHVNPSEWVMRFLKVESTINRYNATKQETLTINNWLHICQARGLDVGGKEILKHATC